MSDYTIIPADNPIILSPKMRERKNRPLLKVITLMLCVMCLMLGSGYMGARIAHGNMVAQINFEAAQVNNLVEVTADRSIELLSSIIPTSGQLTLPELFDGANPAVVAISTEVTGRNAFGRVVTFPSSGSGFFVSSDGYIVTNDHVIENANSITVLLYDGRVIPATVVGRDSDSDIAVIRIEGTNYPFLSFGNSNNMRVGEQVAAIGNPLGELANSMTVGHISALNRDINIDGTSHNKIQTDAAVNRGNSGGPLLNLYGEVIGVVSAKSTGMDVEGLGFAIPSSHAEGIVRQLVDYGFIRGRAILGVTIQYGNGMVQVASVGASSAAERAGIKTGDIILSANGTPLSTFADLRILLDDASPGDTMEMRVRRDNEEITLTAVLDEHRPTGL